MPSTAQIEGRALLDSMLPPELRVPETTIRARRDSAGPAIAFSLMPPRERCPGECQRTVVLPTAPGRRRDAQEGRLRQMVARWIEIEAARRDLIEERRACDETEDGLHEVEDDMPTPPWRISCPGPLRHLCDLHGLDADARLALVEGGSLDLGKATLKVHEREEDHTDIVAARGFRGVRRVTIEAPGLYFSQGVGRCYLRLDQDLPATALSALTDMPVALLVDMPGLDAPGVTVIGRERSSAKGLVLEISRTFALLAAPPSMR